MSEKAIGWSTLYGTMYYFMANQLRTAYGQKGEAVLRKAIHDYGHYRATERRKTHELLGLPINLHSMMNFGDMPGDSLSPVAGRISSAALHDSKVDGCTLFRTWRELGLSTGRIYCEEVHHPMYTDYATGIDLQMPEYLTKYDNQCHFIVTMENADPVERADFSDLPQLTLEEAMARLQGIFFIYLAKAMVDNFSDGEVELRKALRNFGIYRGLKIRKQHHELYGKVDLETLQSGSDVQYGEAVKYHLTDQSQKHLCYEVSKCTFCTGFREKEGINASLGRIYCEEVHKAMAEGYLPGLKVQLPEVMTDGNEKCIILYQRNEVN